MNPIRTDAGVLPAASTEVNSDPLNGARKMNLLHEALSRARMRQPQADRTASTEATRSARVVAMRARQQAARDMGTR